MLLALQLSCFGAPGEDGAAVANPEQRNSHLCSNEIYLAMSVNATAVTDCEPGPSIYSWCLSQWSATPRSTTQVLSWSLSLTGSGCTRGRSSGAHVVVVLVIIIVVA